MGFKFSDPFRPGTPLWLSIYQYPLIINRIWLFINGIRGFRRCWIHWWYFKRDRKWVLLTSGYRQGLWDLWVADTLLWNLDMLWQLPLTNLIGIYCHQDIWTQVVLVISTNFLTQSTLDKLWSPVSPQHLWGLTTHIRSTTSTLRYFMPFPVDNLRWVWSPRWPQDTSSRRSMSTSVSGNQTHISCGNRFQHITWWWIRVISALHVNVTLPILSHDLCVPHNN